MPRSITRKRAEEYGHYLLDIARTEVFSGEASDAADPRVEQENYRGEHYHHQPDRAAQLAVPHARRVHACVAAALLNMEVDHGWKSEGKGRHDPRHLRVPSCQMAQEYRCHSGSQRCDEE